MCFAAERRNENRSVIECELTPSACCVYAESNFRYTQVALEEAEKAAAQDEPLSEIGLSVPALVEAVNARRGGLCGLDGKPLAVLNLSRS